MSGYIAVKRESYNYTCESTESAVTQRSFYRDLFKQNGMDFVTEYLL